MKYFYLLFAGGLVSFVHFYLVWHHRDNRRYSLSEHAILTKKSHLLYFLTHVICDVFFLLFSYHFLIVEHDLLLAFYLNVSFVVFDFIQALLPSRGKTEKIHFASAYVSWISYLSAGIVAILSLDIAQPYLALALVLLAPILGMFIYMHINRSRLYPYQLAIVPMFVMYMLLLVVGVSN